MNKQLKYFLFVILIITGTLTSLIVTQAFAQTATTCAVTDVGNPKDQSDIPADCAGTGGAPGADKAVQLAKSQIGKPYEWATPSRNWKSLDPTGNAIPSYDCSGLVGWAWYWGSGGKVSMKGQTADDWNSAGSNYQKFTPSQLSQIQPGDILYWNPSKNHHTAIYEGKGGCGTNDCFIEAPRTGVPVRESVLSQRIGGSDPLLGFMRPIIK